jgi:hypothetical protein
VVALPAVLEMASAGAAVDSSIVISNTSARLALKAALNPSFVYFIPALLLKHNTNTPFLL